MQSRLKTINNQNILFIQFEDFVLKNENFLEKIMQPYVYFFKNFLLSTRFLKKNIGKFPVILSKNELQTIENNLKIIFFN